MSIEEEIFYRNKCSILEDIITEYDKMQIVLEDSLTYVNCKKQIDYLNSCIVELKES